MLTTLRCSAVLLLGFAVSSVTADDWTGFRDGDGTAIAENADPPAEVDESTITWRAELPGRGTSGPVIVGDRVYITASSGPDRNRLHVLCFDADDGDSLWKRTYRATGRTRTHEKMAVATPTPTSDGERIFAFYSSNDVICHDLNGNLLWYRGLTYDYPNASNSLGMSSSPIVIDKTLICQVEADAEAFTIGLDVATGEQRWKISRPRHANWTSPTILKTDLGTYAVLQSVEGITLIDPKTGNTVAEIAGGASSIPSSTVGSNVIFTPSNGVTAYRLSGSELEKLWNSPQLSPGTPSPVVIGDRVYIINRAGVLAAGNAESGERLWQLRLKGPFSATPVVAGNRMYAVSESGLLQIVSLNDSGRADISDTHDFEETILGTPAVSGDAIYLRSDNSLWKVSR